MLELMVAVRKVTFQMCDFVGNLKFFTHLPFISCHTVFFVEMLTSTRSALSGSHSSEVQENFKFIKVW